MTKAPSHPKQNENPFRSNHFGPPTAAKAAAPPVIPDPEPHDPFKASAA